MFSEAGETLVGVCNTGFGVLVSWASFCLRDTKLEILLPTNHPDGQSSLPYPAERTNLSEESNESHWSW
jgi:hypothetical protein